MGSPLKSVGAVDNSLRDRLLNATYTAVTNIVDACIEYDVDFLVISGDVSDRETRSIRAMEFFSKQMQRLEEVEIPVYMIAGNHDPIRHDTEPIPLPNNVHVFGSESVETVEVQRGKTTIARVLGQSFRNEVDSRKMYSGYSVSDSAIWNIGLLHTGLNPSETKYVPCSLSDLQSKKTIHYWALGHIHQPDILHDKYPVVAYPGIPQGRDIGEPGLGTCLLVRLHPKKKPRLQPIATGTIIWQEKKLYVYEGEEAPENLPELVEQILSSIEMQGNLFSQDQSTLSPRRNQMLKDIVEGFILRCHITGRGEIYTHFREQEKEAVEVITERLRSQLTHVSPFVWIESVIPNIGPVIPERAALYKSGRIYQEIYNEVDEILADEDKSRKVKDRLGQIWETEDIHEEDLPTKFRAGADDLEEIINIALQRVIERVYQLRDEVP